jgi:hypothetical protein
LDEMNAINTRISTPAHNCIAASISMLVTSL